MPVLIRDIHQPALAVPGGPPDTAGTCERCRAKLPDPDMSVGDFPPGSLLRRCVFATDFAAAGK